MTKNVLKNPRLDLDVKANIASAAASKNPKASSSTLPDLTTFYNTGKGVYAGKIF